MKKLKSNWITEGLIDFEYKKYVLLAYLEHVKTKFNKQELYPLLSDLIFHYQNLLSLKENKEIIYQNFPEKLKKADFEKLKLVYKKIVADDDMMKEIEDILAFSIPQLKHVIDEGKDIYGYVAQSIDIEPIGVAPLVLDEGYLFIDQFDRRDVSVFKYQLTMFKKASDVYRGIHMQFLEVVRKSIGRTFERIKLDMIKKYKQLPNPATYLVSVSLHFPFEETLLPVTKRLFMHHINTIER